MSIPKLTEQQLISARLAAAEARRVRAEFKNRIRVGEYIFREALRLAENNEILAHIKVFDFLRAWPRIGVKRAGELMAKYDIADNRRIRGLGRRQADRLISEFECPDV